MAKSKVVQTGVKLRPTVVGRDTRGLRIAKMLTVCCTSITAIGPDVAFRYTINLLEDPQ